jgi:hypothetical protein
MHELIGHGKKGENIDSHQKSTRRRCAGSPVLLEEFAKREFHLISSYPIITRSSIFEALWAPYNI